MRNKQVMASESPGGCLKDEIRKLITAVNDGNNIQANINNRLLFCEEKIIEDRNRVTDLHARLEERQVNLERKLDDVLQKVSQNAGDSLGEVNTSFIEDSNPRVVHSRRQQSRRTAAQQYADVNGDGKFLAFNIIILAFV